MKNIFVSSTFRDFQYERDILRSHVLPQINEIASRYGENVSFCDLRWGVDTTNASDEDIDRQVMNVCLDEIDRARPYMIVLLGERYGYMPGTQIIKNEIRSRRDIDLEDLNISITQLEIEYGALGKNSSRAHVYFYFRQLSGDGIPPEYLNENAGYGEKLKKLKDRILQLGGDHVHFYQAFWNGRKVNGLEEFAETVLRDLKNDLQPDWEAEAGLGPYEKELHLQKNLLSDASEILSPQVFNSVLEKIHARAQGEIYMSQLGALDRKLSYRKTVNRTELVSAVSGLKANQTDILGFLRELISRKESEDEDHGIGRYLLIGDAGSGKTTAAAYLCQILNVFGWDTVVIRCGMSRASSTASSVLKIFLHEMEKRVRLNNPYTERDDYSDEGALVIFRRLIDLYAEKENHNHGRPLLFIADGAERLFPDRLRNSLGFFPAKGNRMVRFLIVSDSRFFPSVYEESWNIRYLTSAEEKQLALQEILRVSGKQLAPSVQNSLISRASSASPQYMELAVQRLSIMNQDDFRKIHEAGDGMDNITAYQLSLLDRIGDRTDELAVELLMEIAGQISDREIAGVLAFLSISRYGLRQNDLETLAQRASLPFYGLHFSQFINYINHIFFIRENGTIDFMYAGLRDGLLKRLDTGKLKGIFADYIRSLPADDEVRLREYPALIWHRKSFESEFIPLMEQLASLPQQLSELASREISLLLHESFDSFTDWLDGYCRHTFTEDEKLRKAPVLRILAEWAASQLAPAQEDRELDLKVTAYNIMTIVQGMIQCGILAGTEGCLLRAAYVSLARRWGDAGMVEDVLNISPHILYDLTEPENENGRRRIKDPSDRIVRTMIGLVRSYHDENGLPSDLVYQCAEACLREAIRQYESKRTNEMHLLVIDAASVACELLYDEKWFTDETLPTVGKRLQAMEKEVIRFEKYPFTMEIRIVMHHYHLARSVYYSRTGLGDPFDEAVNAAVHDQWIITASDTAEYQTLYCEAAIRLARCMAAMHNRSVYEDGVFLIYNRVLAMIPAVLLFNTPYYHRMFVRLCIETGNTLVKGQGLLKEDMLEVSGNVFHIALITLDECMKKWKLPQAEQMLDAVWTGLETVYREKGDKEHMIQAQQRKLARSQDMINARKLILARLKRRPKNETDAIESTLRHMI